MIHNWNFYWAKYILIEKVTKVIEVGQACRQRVNQSATKILFESNFSVLGKQGTQSDRSKQRSCEMRALSLTDWLNRTSKWAREECKSRHFGRVSTIPKMQAVVSGSWRRHDRSASGRPWVNPFSISVVKRLKDELRASTWLNCMGLTGSFARLLGPTSPGKKRHFVVSDRRVEF